MKVQNILFKNLIIGFLNDLIQKVYLIKQMTSLIEKIFKLKENNTNLKSEFLGGFTSFITMAYIIFVNPQIMSLSGMDQGAVFVGTCLAAALACILMGLFANWPVGLAPGMGLNAFFTFTVVGEMGYSWEVALGAVFLAGILFFLMSITRLRSWMIVSIPLNLRIAMGSGVGLFIGFIGLKNGGIIISNDATFLKLGDFSNIETFLAALGFLLISVSSIAPVLLKLDILGAMDLAMITIIMSFLFVNLFDTTGTLLGVADRANLINNSGEANNFDKALKADSSSSFLGALLGCSPVTSYVESSAGVEAGGRTGLTAVFIGLFFLLAIFLSPLALIVPAYATAGALIYVAILMLSGMEKLNWSNMVDLLPALVIIVMIPLTFSIADGIALGFLSYVVLKIGFGEINKISSGAWFLTLIFISKFVFL